VIFQDAQTGAFLFEIKGNYSTVQDIQFSSDGKMVATAGQDGTARLFGVGLKK